MRNDSGYVLICWWVTLFVRVSYLGQVVEINFSSIIFDKFLKIVSSPASLVIYKEEDALLMMFYLTGIYFQE